mmetsp:Transcript_86417/g.252882  ORF Transcript_86417/g.252882 Transcript_86417/m.252882 type:complete len:203 (-) Transcript_86417:1168-1776(-)
MVRRKVHDLVRVGRDGAVGGDAALEARAAHRGGAEEGEAVVALQRPGEHDDAHHGHRREEGGEEALAQPLQDHLHHAHVRVPRQRPHRLVVHGGEELPKEHANLRHDLAHAAYDHKVNKLRELDAPAEPLQITDPQLHHLYENDHDEKVDPQRPAELPGVVPFPAVALVCDQRTANVSRGDDPEGQARKETGHGGALGTNDG